MMKFLKLQLDDQELYNVENTDEKLTFLYNNLPAFRRLYCDQGEVFWLRHLMTFREYLYILIRVKFQQEEGQCLHWLIDPLEKTFIRIHKLLFAGGFEFAKQNLKIMKKHVIKLDAICPLITNPQCRLIASSSVKSAYRALFGSHLGYDKIAIVKAFLASGLYKHFCGSLGVLLKRCDVTIDMPSSFDDNCSNMQYWKPFPFWTKYGYQAEIFENYIVHYYGDRLPEMLLTANIDKTFHARQFHKCCSSFLEDYSTRLIEEPEKYQKSEYLRCDKHPLCYMRVVHSETCKNPHISCLKKPRCAIRCDQDCAIKKLDSKSHKGMWKQNIVTIHQSSQKNCRDASTLVETEKSHRVIETYITHTVDYGYDWNDSEQTPFWRSLPPDLMNFAKQIKRKEKTKSRLRDKLSKKARKEVHQKEDLLNVFQIEQINNLDSFEFRLSLYLKAQKKFREELGDDLLCRLLQGKVGNTDNPLQDLFEEKLELGYLFPKKINNSAAKNFRSVGVGCDIPLHVEFLSDLKSLHIKERLRVKYSTETWKSLQEKVEDLRMSHCVGYLAKNNVTEEQAESSDHVHENVTKIECFIKTDGTSIKKKGKNKKNGKKSHKINNNETISCKPAEEVSDYRSNGMRLDFKLFNITFSEVGIQKIEELLKKRAKDNGTSFSLEESKFKNEIAEMEANPPSQDVSDILDRIEKAWNLEDLRTDPEFLEHNAKDEADDTLDHEVVTEKVLETEPQKNDSENKVKSTKLRICGYCEKQEPTRRTFKKCKLCKDRGSIEPRYYCSKNCQLTDWKGRHEEDHLLIP